MITFSRMQRKDRVSEGKIDEKLKFINSESLCTTFEDNCVRVS